MTATLGALVGWGGRVEPPTAGGPGHDQVTKAGAEVTPCGIAPPRRERAAPAEEPRCAAGHQVSMQLRFFPVRGGGGGAARSASTTLRRDSAGSITSSISKAVATFRALPCS